MVCADAALTPASRMHDARTNEIRRIALPSYPNALLFLVQIFARQSIEINAPAPHSNKTARGCHRQPLGERNCPISSTDGTSNDMGRRF
jgi:hypothetical protein